MDLLDYLAKYGRQSLTELASRAGIAQTYLPQIMGGFRRIKLARAQRLASLHPELDVIALQLMADRVRDIKKRRDRNKARRAVAQKHNGKTRKSASAR